MRDTSFQLKRIHDIFDNDYEEGGINVAVIGKIIKNSLSFNKTLFTPIQTFLFNVNETFTGWEQLIQSHWSARFCFELSRNLN